MKKLLIIGLALAPFSAFLLPSSAMACSAPCLALSQSEIAALNVSTISFVYANFTNKSFFYLFNAAGNNVSGDSTYFLNDQSTFGTKFWGLGNPNGASFSTSLPAGNYTVAVVGVSSDNPNCGTGGTRAACFAANNPSSQYAEANITLDPPPPPKGIVVPTGTAGILTNGITNEISDKGMLLVLGIAAGIPLAFYAFHELIGLIPSVRARRKKGNGNDWA